MKKLSFSFILLFIITNNSIAQKSVIVKVNKSTYSIETNSYEGINKKIHTDLIIRNISDSLRLLGQFYDDNKRMYDTAGATYRNYNSIRKIMMETLSTKIEEILNLAIDPIEDIVTFNFWFDAEGSIKEVGFICNSRFKELITLSELNQIAKKIKNSNFGLILNKRPELSNTRWIYGSSPWNKKSIEKYKQEMKDGIHK